MLDKIKDLVGDGGHFEVDERDRRLRVALPCSSVSLTFEGTAGGDVLMALHCRALPIFYGDRTDVHDVHSWLAAAALRGLGGYSSALIDIEHPASGIPAELYGRHLLPAQAKGHLLSQDEAGLKAADDMLGHLSLLEHFWHSQATLWHPDPELLAEHTYDRGAEAAEDWAGDIAGLLGSASSSEDIYTQRSSTDWYYYRTTDGSVAVAESEDLVDALEPMGASPAEEIAGINGFLYTSETFQHFVPRDAFALADRLFGQKGALVGHSSPASAATVIPLENAVVLAKDYRVVMLRCDSGVSGFARERSLVLERNRAEQERLFPPSEFAWAEEIDGGRFERLIYDLLECEPGVREVRAVGASRERDGGRDLVVSWVTPPGPGEALLQGSAPARERRVIVQCKARKRSVGRSDLGGGVLDTLFMYHGEGYFLAASSQPAAGAIDLLDEVARRGDYFTGWWGRAEIEQRLRRNPHVLLRYADIVHPVP